MNPNFFIIGAPKAGTTALSSYLHNHPNIFISNPKEIHYFAYDLPRYQFVDKKEDYLSIFSDVKPEHLAVGEASVYYLYSSVAVKNIRRFNPSAKIIVMLRNPLELAYSQHSEMLFNCNEDIEDFRQAWALQGARKKGLNIPKGCRDDKVLFYKDIAMFGDQVERLLKFFPRKQIQFIWMEELRSNPRKVYLDVLDFLDVSDDGQNFFSTVNANKRVRYKWLAKVSQTPPLWIVKSVRFMRLRCGISMGGLLKFVRSWNSNTIQRYPLTELFCRELQETFASDVRKLAHLTGKNLNHWLD